MKNNTQEINELSHFKKLSSSWWDEKGPFKTLHGITLLRMAFLKDKMEPYFQRYQPSKQVFQGLRILDVGCGGGLLCEPLARLGAEVTGIDPVEENIVVAKSHAESMGLCITYLPFAIEDLPQELGDFDVIVASEIIEHTVDPDGFLKLCANRLNTRGGMFITTFNKTFKSYFLGIILAEYVLGWAPKGTHSWEKFIAPQHLSQKLLSLGLIHQEMTGLCFSPFTGAWQFSTSLDVNYFFWATKS